MKVSNEELFDERGKFKAGHPKVGGKEKGTRHFTTLVQEALVKVALTDKGEKIEVQKALGEKVVKMALEGNEQMIKLIWNYLDGMPKQSIETTISDDRTKEKLDSLIESLNGKGKSGNQ